MNDPNGRIREDLRRMETDEGAYARLIKTKRDLLSFFDKYPQYRNNSILVEELALLEDIDERGATCSCCGYIGLVRPRLREGKAVGPECASPGHVMPCRRIAS